MKGKTWQRTVPLVAALTLAVTIVVLAMPGATAAASGGTFLQAGWTMTTNGQTVGTEAPCTACYVRIVDNHTGAVTVFKTGDSYASYHWAVWLTLGHEYHFYVEEGAFCAAFSNPSAPYNIDWPPNSTQWVNGGLLEPSDGGVGIAARTLTYTGEPSWLCPI
jgi:hypothetical protein